MTLTELIPAEVRLRWVKILLVLDRAAQVAAFFFRAAHLFFMPSLIRFRAAADS